MVRAPASEDVLSSSLRRYMAFRIAMTIPMLFILVTVVFVLLRVAPGDPIAAAIGDRATEERIEAQRERLGFNDPIIVQYGRYLAGLATLDLGSPISDARTTREIIADTFPATLELTLVAMLVAAVVGIGLGALSGRFRDSPLDIGGRLYGIVIYSMPIFWLGLLFQLVFSVGLGWFPTGHRTAAFVRPEDITGLYVIDSLLTWDMQALRTSIHHLLLPGLTLGLVVSGILVRLVRVNMLQTLQADYVEAASARGVGQRTVVMRHAFKNALVPVVTIIGLQFALLIGGAILTETVFSWPGIGSALVGFIESRDYAAVQGIVTFFALIVVVVSLLIDLLNALIDPRIRY